MADTEPLVARLANAARAVAAWMDRYAAVLVVVMLLVLMALGLYTFHLTQRLNDQQDQLAHQQRLLFLNQERLVHDEERATIR